MIKSNISNLGKHLGLIGGVVVLILLMLTPTPEGLSDAAWKTAAITILMGYGG